MKVAASMSVGRLAPKHSLDIDGIRAISPTPVPDGLRIAWQRHQSALNKVRLLHKQGRLTDTERAEAEAYYHTLWNKRLQHHTQTQQQKSPQEK